MTNSENGPIAPDSTDAGSNAVEGVVTPEISADAPPVPLPGFDQLGLSERILANVKAAGFEKPSPIQSLFIPVAITGVDVMGQAKTGTGKTAAFLLPIFERVKPSGGGSPKVLILAPTRELALQIHSEVVRLGQNLGFTSVTLYGGSSYEPQIEALSKGVDMIVGTPGRVMDHMRQGRLHLENIEMAVLDEADRMLDLGFRKDIEYILRHCPKTRQTLLLSATIADDIQKLAQRFMHEPEVIWTAPETLTVDEVEQYYIAATPDTKLQILLKIMDTERPGLAIVFCGTKRGAKKLAARLKDFSLNAREIHGDLVQSKREKIMDRFRDGKVQILVATDVASRGIDVNNITHIINYDIPFRAEDYVHRIGRTGRMNRGGKAFTLLTREDGELMTEIEMFINRQLQAVSFDTLDSLFWPKPPDVLPPEFTGADTESAVGKDDYLDEDGQPKQSQGGGGDGKRSRRGRKTRGERGERSERGERRERPERKPRPAAGAQDGAGIPDALAQSAPRAENYALLDKNNDDDAQPASWLDEVHGEIREDGTMPGDVNGNLIDGPNGGGGGPRREPRARGERSERGDRGDRGERGERGSRGGRGRDGGRRNKDAFPVVCAQCNVSTTVPFQPDPTRPVYCGPCHKEVKAKRLAAEAAAAANGGNGESSAPVQSAPTL